MTRLQIHTRVVGPSLRSSGCQRPFLNIFFYVLPSYPFCPCLFHPGILFHLVSLTCKISPRGQFLFSHPAVHWTYTLKEGVFNCRQRWRCWWWSATSNRSSDNMLATTLGMMIMAIDYSIKPSRSLATRCLVSKAYNPKLNVLSHLSRFFGILPWSFKGHYIQWNFPTMQPSSVHAMLCNIKPSILKFNQKDIRAAIRSSMNTLKRHMLAQEGRTRKNLGCDSRSQNMVK